LVAETGGSQIVLRDNAGTLEGFPDFEERRLVDGHKDGESQSADVAPNIVGFPVMGTPVISVPPTETTRIEQNIPDGTVAMKEGARVISAEGKHVGNVESVLADPEVDQVTHLMITSGMFAREKRLIPMKWVVLVGEDEVHLRVNKAEVEESADVPVAV
jgi:sporulation protein YlmC with PRC-barrel domain